jgi:transposase-like protein
MHSNSSRRVHGAEFKSKIPAECRKPGVSVASVALAHGLNVNLVRKWLVGRCGLGTQASSPDAATEVAPGISEFIARPENTGRRPAA